MKAHITNLGLENFRVFKDKNQFEFAPITILTGTNSSGKSSLISAMRLIKDNYNSIEITNNEGALEVKPLFEAEFASMELTQKYGSIAKFPHWSDPLHFSFFSKFKFGGSAYTVEFAYKIRYAKRNKANLVKIKAIEDTTNEVVLEVTEPILTKPLEKKVRKKQYLDPSLKIYSVSNPDDVLKRFDIFFNPLAIESDFTNAFKDQLFSLFDMEALETIVESSKYGKRIYTRLYDEDFEAYLNSTVFKFLKLVNWRHPNYEVRESTLIGVKSRNPELHFKLGRNGIFTLRFFIITYLSNCFDLIFTDIENYPEKEYDNISEITRNENDINTYILEFLSSLYSNKFTPDELQDLSALMASMIDYENEQTYSAFKNGLKNRKSINTVYVYSKYHDDYFESLIKDFVSRVFSSLIECFKEDLSFLGSNRYSDKRVKNMLDVDEMSRRVGELTGKSTLQYNEALTYIDKYLSIFGIADEILIETDEDSVNFKPFLLKTDQTGEQRKIHINDFGQGVAKVLPILMSLIQTILIKDPELEMRGFDSTKPKPRILMIEEPESNLHPALQSKLADMFIDAARTFNTQFIIETHSEYLIRKLQYLTAKGEIKPEDTAIYYFYPPDDVPDGEDQVKRIDILKEGRLSSPFGPGFYDESARLMIELMNTHAN